MNKQIFEDFPYTREGFSFSFLDAQLHKYVPIAQAIFLRRHMKLPSLATFC